MSAYICIRTKVSKSCTRILTGLFNKVNQALGIEMEEDLMAEFMACGLAEDSLPAKEPAMANSAAD